MCGRWIHEIYIKCKVSSFNLEVIYVWGTVIVIVVVVVVVVGTRTKIAVFLMSSSPHCALASKFLRSISVLAARSSLWRHILHKQRSAISTNVSAQSCNLEKLIETIERESPSHRNRVESEWELSALFRVTNSQTKYRKRRKKMFCDLFFSSSPSSIMQPSSHLQLAECAGKETHLEPGKKNTFANRCATFELRSWYTVSSFFLDDRDSRVRSNSSCGFFCFSSSNDIVGRRWCYFPPKRAFQ